MKLVVDATVMREKANTLTTIAANVQSLTADINAAVSTLPQSWESETAEIFNQRLASLSESLKTRYEVITSYSSFLMQAADAYKENEKAAAKPLEG